MTERLTGASRLRTHPQMTPVSAHPGRVCLPDRAGQTFDLSADALALLERLRTPARLDAVLPQLSSGLLASIEQLRALGLLVPADVDPRLDVEPYAWSALRAQWQVEPGQTLSPTALIERVGLPHPVPAMAERLLAAGDAVGHWAVCRPLDALSRQWNPYCGHWYYDAPPVERGGRWLQRQTNAAVDALFLTLHEVVHALIGRIGLQGLLRRDPEHLARLHQAGEALAYWVGDMELPLAADAEGYFEGFWPAGAHRSHAHGVAVPAALRALGLKDAHRRIELVRQMYMAPGTVRVEVPRRPAERLGALVILATETTYADYVAHTVQAPWNAHYWTQPAIGRFLDEFAPPGPVDVGGVTIESVDDLFTHAPRIALDWSPPTGAAGRYDAARLAVQRAAMKVAELQAAVEGPRLRLSRAAHAATADRLHEEWGRLAARFAPLRTPTGAIDTDLVADVEAARAQLATDLGEIAQAPVWTFDHPLLGEGGMTTTPSIDPRRWPRVDRARVAQALDTFVSEAHLALAYAGADARLVARCGEAARMRARLVAAAPDAVDAAADWLRDVVDADGLALPFPLDWAHQLAFVEPATGFRFP